MYLALVQVEKKQERCRRSIQLQIKRSPSETSREQKGGNEHVSTHFSVPRETENSERADLSTAACVHRISVMQNGIASCTMD